MKDFNYHSAKDSKEASKLASSSSAFLAGGMNYYSFNEIRIGYLQRFNWYKKY